MRTITILLGLLLLALPAAAGADTFEPNDSVAEAHGPLFPGAPLQSYIGADGDVDWYYFDADLGDLTITLTDIPVGNDYDLYLTDEDENIFAESFNSDNEDEEITGQVTGGGRFWILVDPFEGFSDTQPYTLTVTFTPLNQDPVVTVIHPNGGETLVAGSAVDLTWSANDAEDGAALTVDIAYSANNGASWSAVATGTDNDGTHPWTVPAEVTAQGLIRVTAADGDGGSGFDVSDAPFAVESGTTPELALALPPNLGPAEGEVFDIEVTFSSNVPVGALQFAIVFDPLILESLEVTAGPAAGALTMESNLAVEGQARVVFYSPQGTDLDPVTGVICVLQCRRLGYVSQAQGYSVDFADVVAGDPSGNELPVDTSGSLIVAVRGVTLAAEAAAGGVRLSWTAEADDAHAGFRVLREERGTPVAVHDGLLARDARAYIDRTAPAGASLRYWLEAVDRAGSTQRFGPVEVIAPAALLWAGVPYPNPSRATVSLDVRRSPDSPARAVVVDAAGRVVRELEVPVAGTLAWDGRLGDGRAAPAGVYFLHLRQEDRSVTRRVVRLAGR